MDSQLKEVNRHPWVIAGGKGEMDLEDPMMEVCMMAIMTMMTMMTMMTLMTLMMAMMAMVVMKTISTQVVQTHIIPSDDTIDADVIQVLIMTMIMII